MEGIVASSVLFAIFAIGMLVADHQRAKRWNALMAEVDRAMAQVYRVAERRQQWKVISQRMEKQK